MVFSHAEWPSQSKRYDMYTLLRCDFQLSGLNHEIKKRVNFHVEFSKVDTTIKTQR